MTNTKFRKRALLSSVAMLLVALVALGSATFAWFTTNPYANAEGIKLKANTSVGLVIQSASERAVIATLTDSNTDNYWSHDAVLRAASYDATNKVFVPNAQALGVNPASMNASGTLYKVQAAADDNYIADDDATVGTTTNEQDFYAEEIYLKITGSTTATAVTLTGCDWTAGSGALANAVRVAILDGTTILASFAPSANTANDFLKSTGEYSAQLNGTDREYTQKAASGLNINCGTFTTKTLKVVVYLDGEDSAVFSQNIASADLQSIFDSLELNFEAAH